MFEHEKFWWTLFGLNAGLFLVNLFSFTWINFGIAWVNAFGAWICYSEIKRIKLRKRELAAGWVGWKRWEKEYEKDE